AETGVGSVVPAAQAGAAPINERVAVPRIPRCRWRDGRELAAARDVGDHDRCATSERDPCSARRPFRIASLAKRATLPVRRAQYDDTRAPVRDLCDRERLAIALPSH